MTSLRARLISAVRWARIGRQAVRAVLRGSHPLLAHLIVTRRCNLACAYCEEYDSSSAPVERERLEERIDRLAALGTAAVTLSGGEPLLHPDLPELVARLRRRGMLASVITNGALLSRERIRALNRAGLDHLEISIDNLEPDEVSTKSLRLLEPKLRWLAEEAEFRVALNCVLGSGVRRPEDALLIAGRARELGFWSSVGILHGPDGQLRPLGEREREVYRELRRRSRGFLNRLNAPFQEDLADGRPHDWSCRAGARYLYVDEAGLVSYCSQRRGAPGVPLALYGRDRLRAAFDEPKPCAAYCTVNCVQQAALFDRWRPAHRPGQEGARAPVGHEGVAELDT